MSDKNFELQDVINIIGEQAVIVKQNGLDIGAINEQVGIISKKITRMDGDIGSIKDDIKDLKENEEITSEQVKRIKNTAKRRVYECLNINTFKESLMSDEELDNYLKYFRTFIVHLYNDTKMYTGLASQIECTKKREYQRALDFIEAWTPKEGIEKLKLKIDTKAKRNRELKAAGY